MARICSRLVSRPFHDLIYLEDIDQKKGRIETLDIIFSSFHEKIYDLVYHNQISALLKTSIIVGKGGQDFLTLRKIKFGGDQHWNYFSSKVISV